MHHIFFSPTVACFSNKHFAILDHRSLKTADRAFRGRQSSSTAHQALILSAEYAAHSKTPACRTRQARRTGKARTAAPRPPRPRPRPPRPSKWQARFFMCRPPPTYTYSRAKVRHATTPCLFSHTRSPRYVFARKIVPRACRRRLRRHRHGHGPQGMHPGRPAQRERHARAIHSVHQCLFSCVPPHT